jgi:hypothetical protein
MDLDTFLTRLYVWIDDWYKAEMAEQLARRHGPIPKMSDSEVLTVAIAGQWRCGVPWQSERGLVRYMQKQGRGWFPHMLERSRFNEQVRYLWAAIIKLQQALAVVLKASQALYEVVDCLPLPGCSNAQSLKRGHWLWWGTRGHGGTQGGWYWGDQLILSVTPQHVITGWLIGPANIDDRVMLQALLSQRQGRYHFCTPTPWRPWRELTAPSFMHPLLAAGAPTAAACYLGDKGFNGFRWQRHWFEQYAVSVITEPSRQNRPSALPRSWVQWLRGMRQAVETVLALLTCLFSIKHLRAHSQLGQRTRVALATAAYNWGIWMNRQSHRPDLSHATLLA